jgi:hypothetical protein
MAEIRVLTRGPKHHFFGYYGVDAWDPAIEKHLALETGFDDHRPIVEDRAVVGLVDRDTGGFTPYAETSAFNLQQGSMMHWIDAGFGAEFTYNDWEDDRLMSRALNPETGKLRTLNSAVAAISPTKPEGIGLSFARMAMCRAVVGYASNIDENSWADQPEDDGLFAIDFKTGESVLLLSIADVLAVSSHPASEKGKAWFNHVYYNTDGTRLMFLCRIRETGKHKTSMWTVNVDGSDLECQIEFDYHTSHFAWRDPQRIMISTSVSGEMQFVEFVDREKTFEAFGNGKFPRDGHNAFSPNREWVVCDWYPKNEARLAGLMLYNIERDEKIMLGEFHHDEIYTGDVRCDLHPRWSRDGQVITFDSVHGDTRQIYLVDVSDIVN